MIKKLDTFKLTPKGMKPLLDMEAYLGKETTIEPLIRELIKMRASQINGCAYCLNMHTTDTLKLGETAQRIFLLNAWQETNLFTDKEKAVLEFVEKVTLIADFDLDEEVYENLSQYFSDKEIVDLTLYIATINAWNRLNIVFNNLVV